MRILKRVIQSVGTAFLYVGVLTLFLGLIVMMTYVLQGDQPQRHPVQPATTPAAVPTSGGVHS